MLKRMWMTYLTIGRTFNKWLGPLFTGFNLCIHHIVVSVLLKIDYLFFPSLWKKRVQQPIVIVGNPRSGTTFLHRFLGENNIGVGMQVWKMIYPSLIQQMFIKPLLPVLDKFSPTRHHSKVSHATSLTSVETDDPATLFRYFDGFFLYGFFLAWAEKDLVGMFDPEVRDTSRRDFQYYRAIWRRNLVGADHEQVCAKLFSLGIRIPQFLQEFPDAKILYLIRDPRSTVPSGMSLVTGVLDQRFQFWSLSDAKRKRYINRLYRAFLDLSVRFHNDYKEGKFSKERVMILPFHRMMQDFDELMHEVLDFLHIKPSRSLLSIIRETAEKQRQFKSSHQYDLTQFGLSEEQILRDYAPIYKTFGIPK